MIADKRVLSLDAEGAESIGSWWMRRLIASRREAGRQDEGFTLIEVIIVIVVIAILSAFALPVYNGMTDRAKETTVNQVAGNVDRHVKTEFFLGRSSDDINEDVMSFYDREYGARYPNIVFSNRAEEDTNCFAISWLDNVDTIEEIEQSLYSEHYYAVVGEGDCEAFRQFYVDTIESQWGN